MPLGSGWFGGGSGQSTGWVLWWFGEEEGAVCLCGGEVLGTVFLWAFQGQVGGESRSKHPNPLSKLGDPGLGKLHSHTAGTNGDKEQEATLLMSLP